MNEKGEGSFKPLIIVMGISLVIAFFWDSLKFISVPVHYALDPSAGALLEWNLTAGMLIIIFLLTLLSTIAQKYATDQKTMKELKEKQKEINKKAQEYKHDPQKMMEVQKELGPLTIKMIKLNSRSIMFTGIPFILFFRWFGDFFSAAGEPLFFGFLSWIWFYLIFMIIFGSIIRKFLKVV